VNNRLLGCGLFVLALCAGCAHKAYEGEEKPSEAVAVINDSYTGSLRWDRASITAVDDKRWEWSEWSMPEQVEVLPGDHKVSIYCWHGFGPSHSAGLLGRVGSVDFNAQAGHDYQVFCGIDNGRYVRWITDLTTGEIVGGKSK
jgi:hypothetical protein